MSTDRTLAKKASQIYAANLLEAAKEKNLVFEFTSQLDEVLHTVFANVELRNTLADHGIDMGARQAIANEIFASCDASLLAVLSVIVERGDIMLLSRISEEYLSLAEETLGAVIIDVTTVVSLDDALRESIKKKYAAELGTSVILREHIDASIVGGVVLSSHGRRIDASVVTQLENARATLSKGVID